MSERVDETVKGHRERESGRKREWEKKRECVCVSLREKERESNIKDESPRVYRDLRTKRENEIERNKKKT